MTLEDKLDQDFLFYLGFTNTFFDYVESARDKHMCFVCTEKHNQVLLMLNDTFVGLVKETLWRTMPWDRQKERSQHLSLKFVAANARGAFIRTIY